MTKENSRTAQINLNGKIGDSLLDRLGLDHALALLGVFPLAKAI